MSFVISSLLPFPNIAWWCRTLDQTVVFDLGERFEKMSYRNRYYIAGANGVITLSIPVEGGRNNRTPMNALQISNAQDWQKQHWRTLYSAYNRSPFFGHYAPSLEKLFTTPFTHLTTFNRKTLDWLSAHAGLKLTAEFRDTYQKAEDRTDLRLMKPGLETAAGTEFPAYFQVFGERAGFHPNLSILDLLFTEGPYAGHWLRSNASAVLKATEAPTKNTND